MKLFGNQCIPRRIEAICLFFFSRFKYFINAYVKITTKVVNLTVLQHFQVVYCLPRTASLHQSFTSLGIKPA